MQENLEKKSCLGLLCAAYFEINDDGNL